MKKSTLLIICSISLMAFLACNNASEQALNSIRKAESELYPDSTMMPDAEKAKNMIGLYTEYASKYPEDTLSPGFLFKAADVSSKINLSSQAIELFGKFISQYPSHPNAAYALFLQGFIFENQMGDPAKAKPYYEKFLNTYPEHPLAQDAKFSLDNLGKSPEELIREFEMRQSAEDSAAVAAQ